MQCSIASYIVYNLTVIPEPVITTCPINATVDTVGLPITLTCEVSGDPTHYWVGWMHKKSIIQTGDEHSVSVLPSLMSPNCTSYHLKVHSVKFPGKYTCQVFSIEGKHLSNVTHQVSVKGTDIHQCALHLILTFVLFKFQKVHLNHHYLTPCSISSSVDRTFHTIHVL